MLRPLVTAILLAGLGAGCTTQLEIAVIHQPGYGPFTRRDDTCDTELFGRDEHLPDSCVEVGDVFVGDTGWTTDCGAARVRDEVRRQTCRFGADAAQIVREREPSLVESSCDQIRARLLQCAEEGERP